MEITLTYTLLLTHYEVNLLNDDLDWNNVINQDFCVHCLYANDFDKILFLSDYTKVDCKAQMSLILNVLTKLGYEIKLRKKICIVPNNIDEYDEQAVLEYLH